MGFTLRTAFGTRDCTPAAIAAEIEAARDVEDAFVTLERTRDGAFVQYDGRNLDFGRNGRLHRFDTARAAGDAFARFLAGDDLDRAPGWREVTHELDEAAATRRRDLLYGLILGLVVAGVLALGWWLLRGAGS